MNCIRAYVTLILLSSSEQRVIYVRYSLSLAEFHLGVCGV